MKDKEKQDKEKQDKEKQDKRPPASSTDSEMDISSKGKAAKQVELVPAKDQDDKRKTVDINSPRARNPTEQVKVWDDEGGSPPEQISSTNLVKPQTDAKTDAKAGSMGSSED